MKGEKAVIEALVSEQVHGTGARSPCAPQAFRGPAGQQVKGEEDISQAFVSNQAQGTGTGTPCGLHAF
jgi:hypothetical protein